MASSICQISMLIIKVVLQKLTALDERALVEPDEFEGCAQTVSNCSSPQPRPWLPEQVIMQKTAFTKSQANKFNQHNVGILNLPQGFQIQEIRSAWIFLSKKPHNVQNKQTKIYNTKRIILTTKNHNPIICKNTEKAIHLKLRKINIITSVPQW